MTTIMRTNFLNRQSIFMTSSLFYSGSNVSSYINMVCETLRNTIPKAVVHCQVKEAKRNLLNRFYAHVGSKEVCFILP
jgi:hypothetical protein